MHYISETLELRSKTNIQTQHGKCLRICRAENKEKYLEEKKSYYFWSEDEHEKCEFHQTGKLFDFEVYMVFMFFSPAESNPVFTFDLQSVNVYIKIWHSEILMILDFRLPGICRLILLYMWKKYHVQSKCKEIIMAKIYKKNHDMRQVLTNYLEIAYYAMHSHVNYVRVSKACFWIWEKHFNTGYEHLCNK